MGAGATTTRGPMPMSMSKWARRKPILRSNSARLTFGVANVQLRAATPANARVPKRNMTFSFRSLIRGLISTLKTRPGELLAPARKHEKSMSYGRKKMGKLYLLFLPRPLGETVEEEQAADDQVREHRPP